MREPIEAPCDGQCPLRDLLNRMGDKWSALVVLMLSERTHRFGELRRRVRGISQRMLTDSLRGMERDGLVERRAFPTVPVTVEYSLTDLGRSLFESLAMLARWAESSRPEILRSRTSYDARERQEAGGR